MIRPSIQTHSPATTKFFLKPSARPVASGTIPQPTSAIPMLFARLGKTETPSATLASTSHLPPLYASNRASSMLPQISDAKPKLSAELTTDTSQALIHANTLLPPFKSAPHVANFSIQLAPRASPELIVDVSNISHRRTLA